MLAEELYKHVGAATVLRQKYMLIGKYLIGSNIEEAKRRLKEDVNTASEALTHYHMVQGMRILYTRVHMKVSKSSSECFSEEN